MQLHLSKTVNREDTLPSTISSVAGVDVAYIKGMSIGAASVLDYDSLAHRESKVSYTVTRFSYIPTFLSFREIAPAYSVIRKLEVHPDVFLVDGHGIAHPYRFGFATHLGLVMNVATVGVAKSLLCGRVEALNEQEWAPVTDQGEIIGAEVVTKPGTKPLYVSVGNGVTLERAIEIVRDCTRTYKTPEPIRRAHLRANEEKRRLQTRKQPLPP